MKQFIFPSCTCGPSLLFLACYFILPTAFCADTVFFYPLLACTQTFKHVSWQATNRSDLACFWDLVRWQNKKMNVRWSECYMQLSPVLSTFLLLPVASSCITTELLQSLEVLHSRLAHSSHRLSLKPLNKVGLKLGMKGWFPLIMEDLASGVLRYHLRKWLEQLANDWAKSVVTTGETCCLAGEWQLSASSQNVTSVCRLQLPKRIVSAKVPFINVLPKWNNLKVLDGVQAFICYLFKTIKTDLS